MLRRTGTVAAVSVAEVERRAGGPIGGGPGGGDRPRRARLCAARIGRPLTRVGVRDTRSRWGSCSAKGSLSFSWRLVLMPEAVMDYVVAHEVAHLVEMNHG